MGTSHGPLDGELGCYVETSTRPNQFALTHSPQTRETLLLRLRDGGDRQAWSEFVNDYGPMLYRFVRSRGLQDADAADIVQDVMRRVGGAIGKLDYEKQKGGFRAWLFTITRNRLYTFFEQRQRNDATVNDTAQFELLSQSQDSRNAGGSQNELDEQWELEYMRQLAGNAMEIIEADVEPKTWQAFHRTALDGVAASAVATELGMSTGAVYVAKSRVIARLRGEIERMQTQD